jgi:serine/threonine protein kinase
MLNLKSFYEVGNLLGKGNFAKVYEATNLNNKNKKYALKTIEKQVLSKCKRNFVSIFTLLNN